MAGRLVLLFFLSTFIYQVFCCQPTPTTSQQIRTIVADPVVAPRLIRVNPSQVPLAPADAPVQTISDLLKIPMPTLPSLVPTTTSEPLNETEQLEFANSTVSDESFLGRNSTELETDPINGTESSGDLIKELTQAEQSVISSFNKKNPKEFTTLRPSLKLFAPSMKEDSRCESSSITAITIMPYDDRLVGVDLDKVHEQLKLLESFTRRTVKSFGEFEEEVENIDGKFSLRLNIKHLKTTCSELRQFCTKAVSYSREIERIRFTCGCEPTWIIAKRKPDNQL